ncbi:hypothetical protein HXX76_014814 [Chlamydomonas incerta]|uniref:Exostosin GT47 domain-containing protein n=1 Tax=Chlamydomonas incerta TaxID=51695 RepID=A0A835VS97_CHLIN|nr:hypothetical protein HXX76_014814 [Chlamydomonas incerta]|eukprot:KAG2423988.1 hypothetical protein HXX76_014814 [Chlamydomonas incerta]
MALQRPLIIALASCGPWLLLMLLAVAAAGAQAGPQRRALGDGGSSTVGPATHEQEPAQLQGQGFAERLAQQLLHQQATEATSQSLQHHSRHQHQHPHHTNPRMHHANASSSSASATVVPAGQDPGRCTMGSPGCFNAERCRKGFSLYVYPPAAGAPVTCSFDPAAPLSSLDLDEARLYGACFLHTLLHSRGLPRAARPQDACVLVPALDANCAFNTCDEPRLTQLGSMLAALPHWDGGRNHLVFNYNNDWEHARFPTGQAIVARASWVKQTYRRGYDIQLPLTRPKITPPDPWVLQWGQQLLEADRRTAAHSSSSSSSISNGPSSSESTSSILSPWQKLELPQLQAGADADAAGTSAAGNVSQSVTAQKPGRRLAGVRLEASETGPGAWGTEDTEALGGRLWSWDSKLLPAAQQPHHGGHVLQPQPQLQPMHEPQAVTATQVEQQWKEARARSAHSTRRLARWFWPWGSKKTAGGSSGGDGAAVPGGANFGAAELKGPLRHDLLLYFNGCLLPRWYDCDTTRPRLFDILNKQLPPEAPEARRGVVLQARCCGDHAAGPAAVHCGGCVDNRRQGRGGGMDNCTAAWPDIGFGEGMRRARFALSPRGCGSQSYRLLEAAGLGAVPVHVGDTTVMPFDGEAGLGRLWSECAVGVTMAEVEAGQLLPRLWRLEEEGGGQGYVARQGACARLAALRSWEVRVVALQAVCTVALRVEALFEAGGAGAAAAAGGEGRMPDQMRQLCASVGAVH